MKRKASSAKIDTGRWLITYSDMMNNLLVLFMVLYAMSVLNMEKFRALAQQFSNELSPANASVIVPTGKGGLPETEPEDEVSAQEFDALYAKLKAGIEDNGYDEFIELEKGDSFIKFKFKDNVLFYPDSARMRQNGVEVLQYVGTLLSEVNEYTETIEIGGHTAQTGAETQITTFAWELSADRAISVLQYLCTNCGLVQSKMSIAGYSHYDPIGDNSTEDGRAANRRVEIKVIRVTGGNSSAVDAAIEAAVNAAAVDGEPGESA
ncbi:MAG TPA: flagellar motor protein MotB [Terriglobales bacterium]|nr:flagellar motor protein MotB [Candidatus Acidoferrum sp.]HWQ51484.1 flagellar motor protein MotB [Terriglobales bacterium]